LNKFLGQFAARVARNSTCGLDLERYPSCPSCPREDSCITSIRTLQTEKQVRLLIPKLSDCSLDRDTRSCAKDFLRFSATADGIYNLGALHALASIPKLKVIVMIRDPVEQFVLLYNYYKRVSLEGCPEIPHLHFLVGDIINYQKQDFGRSSVLWYKDRLLHFPWTGLRMSGKLRMLHRTAGRLVEQLQYAQELFKGRVHVLHLDELIKSPEKALKDVLLFLGISTDRFNICPTTIPGFGLRKFCSNSTASRRLRTVLREMLDNEYTVLYGPLSRFAHLQSEPCQGQERR